MRLNKENVKFNATLKWTFLSGVGGKKGGGVSELYTLCKTLIDDGAVTSHGSKEEGGGSELLATRSARCCWMMAYFHRTAVCVCVCVYSLSAAAGSWTPFPWRQHPLVNLWRCRAQQKAQPVKCMGGMVEGGWGWGGGASWTSVALRLACQLGQGL